MIDESLSLLSIESTLKRKILAKRQAHVLNILGELNLSEDEYYILVEKLREFFANPRYQLKDLLDKYPVSITTAAVFMTKYRYDRNFWGAFGEELGRDFNPANQGLIGSTCLRIFKVLELYYDDTDMVRTYLDPICYEAGVPTAGSLDGLFYAVKYDSGLNFDPVQLIDDLIDERTYGVRKALKRYLKQFRNDRAIDCILEIHDAVLSVEQGIPGNSWYIRSCEDWFKRDAERTAKTKKGQENVIAKPYLAFDERFGLSMQMPRIILEQEWIEKPKWTILCDEDGRDIERTMWVSDDLGRRKIGETKIPIPPAKKYIVTLSDSEALEDEDSIKSWEVNGIQEGSILMFNADGRAVSPKYLLYPYMTLLFADNSAKIKKAVFTEENEHYYPLLQGSTARVFTVTPLDYRAKLIIVSSGKEISLESRPRVEISLEGEQLFDAENEKGLRIFTELPLLSLNVDDGVCADAFEIRCGQTVLKPSESGYERQNKVYLSSYESTCFSKFGIYSIRIYKDGLFIKSIDFGYAPYIDTDYNPLLQWPAQSDKQENLEIVFDYTRTLKNHPELDISFDFNNVLVKGSDTRYIVECPPHSGILQGSLIVERNEAETCSKLVFPFELPLRPFDITIIKSDCEQVLPQPGTTIRKFALEDINRESFWILLDSYGEYSQKEFVLKLHTIDGYIQTERLKKNSCNSSSCNISAFSASLNNCPLPARFELFALGDDVQFLPVATVVREQQLDARPLHRFHENKSEVYFKQSADKGKDLILKPFESPDRKIVIPYENSFERTGTSKTPYRFFAMPALQPGFYSVSAGENDEDPFGFEEDFGIPLSNGSDTLYVTDNTKRNNYIGFSDWLDSLMSDILRTGQLKGLAETETYALTLNCGLSRWENVELSEKDIINLVALLWFSEDKQCSKEKIGHIKQCMNDISSIILNAESRAMLAKYMLSKKCPPYIINSAIDNYDFVFMNISCEDTQLAEQLAPYSDELALFVLMKQDAQMREVFNERGKRTLGRDAVLQMMKVEGEDMPYAVALEQRNFIQERKGAKIQIVLPSELAGKEDWITPLIVFDKKRIYLDLNNMPAEGIPFVGVRFAEQCVNWFRLRLNRDLGSRDIQLLDKEIESTMIRAIKQDCVQLMKYYKAAGNDIISRNVQKRYNHGISKRYSNDPTLNLSAGIPMRFFYIQAVAAFISLMPDRYNPNPEAVRTGQHFLSVASRVAPRMVRRDILMAETFFYLMGKEEKLCQ